MSTVYCTGTLVQGEVQSVAGDAVTHHYHPMYVYPIRDNSVRGVRPWGAAMGVCIYRYVIGEIQIFGSNYVP